MMKAVVENGCKIIDIKPVVVANIFTRKSDPQRAAVKLSSRLPAIALASAGTLTCVKRSRDCFHLRISLR